MALNERLQRLLEQTRVRYQVLTHNEAFTAQEVAAASHVPGAELAKVVVLREEGGFFLMVVLPAPRRLDLAAVVTATGRQRLQLATEEEIRRLFPDCEAGAMPPFGNLYDMPAYVDACFRRHRDFFFQGGNHHEVVAMAFEDYVRLAQPMVGQLCFHHVEGGASV